MDEFDETFYPVNYSMISNHTENQQQVNELNNNRGDDSKTRVHSSKSNAYSDGGDSFTIVSDNSSRDSLNQCGLINSASAIGTTSSNRIVVANDVSMIAIERTKNHEKSEAIAEKHPEDDEKEREIKKATQQEIPNQNKSDEIQSQLKQVAHEHNKQEEKFPSCSTMISSGTSGPPSATNNAIYVAASSSTNIDLNAKHEAFVAAAHSAGNCANSAAASAGSSRFSANSSQQQQLFLQKTNSPVQPNNASVAVASAGDARVVSTPCLSGNSGSAGVAVITRNPALPLATPQCGEAVFEWVNEQNFRPIRISDADNDGEIAVNHEDAVDESLILRSDSTNDTQQSHQECDLKNSKNSDSSTTTITTTTTSSIKTRTTPFTSSPDELHCIESVEERSVIGYDDDDVERKLKEAEEKIRDGCAREDRIEAKMNDLLDNQQQQKQGDQQERQKGEEFSKCCVMNKVSSNLENVELDDGDDNRNEYDFEDEDDDEDIETAKNDGKCEDLESYLKAIPISRSNASAADSSFSLVGRLREVGATFPPDDQHPSQLFAMPIGGFEAVAAAESRERKKEGNSDFADNERFTIYKPHGLSDTDLNTAPRSTRQQLVVKPEEEREPSVSPSTVYTQLDATVRHTWHLRNAGRCKWLRNQIQVKFESSEFHSICNDNNSNNGNAVSPLSLRIVMHSMDPIPWDCPRGHVLPVTVEFHVEQVGQQLQEQEQMKEQKLELEWGVYPSRVPFAVKRGLTDRPIGMMRLSVAVDLSTSLLRHLSSLTMPKIDKQSNVSHDNNASNESTKDVEIERLRNELETLKQDNAELESRLARSQHGRRQLEAELQIARADKEKETQRLHALFENEKRLYFEQLEAAASTRASSSSPSSSDASSSTEALSSKEIACQTPPGRQPLVETSAEELTRIRELDILRKQRVMRRIRQERLFALRHPMPGGGPIVPLKKEAANQTEEEPSADAATNRTEEVATNQHQPQQKNSSTSTKSSAKSSVAATANHSKPLQLPNQSNQPFKLSALIGGGASANKQQQQQPQQNRQSKQQQLIAAIAEINAANHPAIRQSYQQHQQPIAGGIESAWAGQPIPANQRASVNATALLVQPARPQQQQQQRENGLSRDDAHLVVNQTNSDMTAELREKEERLKSMGFDNKERIQKLLRVFKCDIQTVIDQLLAEEDARRYEEATNRAAANANAAPTQLRR